MFHPSEIKNNLDKAPLDGDREIPNSDPADNYVGVFLSHAEVSYRELLRKYRA